MYLDYEPHGTDRLEIFDTCTGLPVAIVPLINDNPAATFAAWEARHDDAPVGFLHLAKAAFIGVLALALWIAIYVVLPA